MCKDCFTAEESLKKQDEEVKKLPKFAVFLGPVSSERYGVCADDGPLSSEVENALLKIRKDYSEELSEFVFDLERGADHPADVVLELGTDMYVAYLTGSMREHADAYAAAMAFERGASNKDQYWYGSF